MRKIIFLAILVIAAGFVLYGYFDFSNQGRDSSTTPVSGNIEVTTVDVSFKIPGKIEKLAVEEGDQVSEGQVIASLEHRDLTAQKTKATFFKKLNCYEKNMTIFPLKRKKRQKDRKKIPLLAGLLWAVISFHAYAEDIVVTVDRFTDIGNKAPVRFSICDSDECHRKRDKGYQEIKAHLIDRTEHTRIYKIENVTPGEYSLSAYHDLNNSGILERSGILGIPKEPIGFSAIDIKKIQRHPKWDEVKFTVHKQETSVNIHLIHRFVL